MDKALSDKIISKLESQYPAAECASYEATLAALVMAILRQCTAPVNMLVAYSTFPSALHGALVTE